MVDARDILKFTDEIARRFKPRKIILFGSYAYGTPTEDSDVDLLVVIPHRGPSYRKASEIAGVADRSFACDLIVRSPTDLEKRLRWHDFFLMEIVEKGIHLHDASNRRVGGAGRRRLLKRTSTAAITQVA